LSLKTNIADERRLYRSAYYGGLGAK
jgi:hypothetical protein